MRVLVRQEVRQPPSLAETVVDQTPFAHPVQAAPMVLQSEHPQGVAADHEEVVFRIVCDAEQRAGFPHDARV
jgi:hypothetical protein